MFDRPHIEFYSVFFRCLEINILERETEPSGWFRGLEQSSNTGLKGLAQWWAEDGEHRVPSNRGDD